MKLPLRLFRADLPVRRLFAFAILVALVTAALVCGVASAEKSDVPASSTVAGDVVSATFSTKDPSAAASSTSAVFVADTSTSVETFREPVYVTTERVTAVADQIRTAIAEQFSQLAGFAVVTARKLEDPDRPALDLLLGGPTNQDGVVCIIIQRNCPDSAVPTVSESAFPAKEVEIAGSVAGIIEDHTNGAQVILLLADHTMVSVGSSGQPGTRNPAPIGDDDLQKLAELVATQFAATSF